MSKSRLVGSAKKQKHMPRQKTYKKFGEDVKEKGRQMERQGGFPTAPGLTPAGEEQWRRWEALLLTRFSFVQASAESSSQNHHPWCSPQRQ